MIVCIQDKRNKIPGCAYCKWGSAEMYDHQELFETKMPTGRTPSGSINYKIFNGAGKEYRKVTKCYPSYSGARKRLMSNILSCYYMVGEVTYNENIDTRILVAKIKD